MTLVNDRVKVTYKPGLKCSLISQDNILQATGILKKDILALRLPHPPTANISVVRTGVIEFFWNTKKGGVGDDSATPQYLAQTVFVGQTLDDILIQKLRNCNRAELQTHLGDLLIQDIEFYSTPAESRGEKTKQYPNLSWTRPQITEESRQNTHETLQNQAQEFLDDIGEKMLVDSSPVTIPPRSHNLFHPSRSSGTSSVYELVYELTEIRKQLATGLKQEAAIIDELKRMHSQAPGPSPNTITAAGSELVVTARLQMIEEQIETERQRRRAAEDSLSNIQRECREPFMVPALLDAFVMISKLSTQVMESNDSNN
ncbi:hypothetical protein E1B28_011098 [Marasmius oreades]|uniref:Uncharacterized protein n=1 Tax=Marasmius oreades TaxID=181124 RepID=A0A9P7RU39_9AGAR|nr:uncharacterized protein E1B28_011098 [Marasmius oreades]KAG7089410.1 hypothetical protein E1B28_011098 [Marasmius oreades]